MKSARQWYKRESTFLKIMLLTIKASRLENYICSEPLPIKTPIKLKKRFKGKPIKCSDT